MWATKNKQSTAPLSPAGFTIVELLIVIVVIAILAAITTVAYNGIQDRARASAASSALSQVNKKLAIYMLDNSSYPPDLATAGVTTSGNTTYQYSVNNTATPATYCVTATNGNVSYTASSSATNPTRGGCAGHGADGVAAITNLATNPSFEAGLGVNSYYASNSWGTGGGASGSRFMRSTRTTTSGASGPWWDAAVPTPGQSYRVTLSVRGNVSTARDLRIEWINAAGSSQVGSQTLATVSPTGSWTTVTGTGTAPTGAGRLRLTLYTPTTSTGTTSDYVDIDNVMITEGTTSYTFADGNTTNWVWNGTVNSSTSTGPGQ